MLRDYLIFYKAFDLTQSEILRGIVYFTDDWKNDAPETFTFHTPYKKAYRYTKGSIIKLFSIERNGDEVVLKEIKLQYNINDKLKCYFAHSWRSKDHPDKIRIVKALESRNIIVIDPFNGEDGLCTEYNEKEYYPNCNYKLGRAIWIKDLAQIRDCDMFLMWVEGDMPGRFMGTSYELAYAYDHGKFIQIISDLRHPYMAFVLCHGNLQYNSIEDFENLRSIRWK